jgi:N-acetylglucosaminyldiphosphoundecaprenol N-acetyl-beta-D-mannosaminyltransferase
MFGMRISRTTMREAVAAILSWCGVPRGDACRIIVTPNVDHAVMHQTDAELQTAYREASMVLADGAPLVAASRLLRKQLPERVAGSDLVPQLFANASATLRVFLLGAAPGVAEIAAARIKERWPAVFIVGIYSPPIGFERDEFENRRILKMIEAASAELLILGLGAPKQEIWAARYRQELSVKVAICAGATIDFLAGHRRRSPRWMRRVGLEWFHRVCAEPRRLARRYARDAWVFPQLLWREWRQTGG